MPGCSAVTEANSAVHAPVLQASSPRMGSTPQVGELHRLPPACLPSIPNIPNPVNGMIKTYSNANRTFSRPYSAKTVFFYKEGDQYFTGVRVPVSKSRYRNMNSLLDDLNDTIELPFGVRRLHTPYGGTPIRNIDQLEHLGKYVASSSHKLSKPLDLSAVERHQRRMRAIVQQRWENYQKSNNSANTSTQRSPQPGPSRALGIMLPLASKQMFFVLNGHPGRLHRVVLEPYKKRDMETILEEVSRGLETAIWKLYSFSGERLRTVDQLMACKESRILAVPRYERPVLPSGIIKDVPSSPSSSGLPAIKRSSLFNRNVTKLAAKAFQEGSKVKSTPVVQPSATKKLENGIPRTVRNFNNYQPHGAGRIMATTVTKAPVQRKPPLPQAARVQRVQRVPKRPTVVNHAVHRPINPKTIKSRVPEKKKVMSKGSSLRDSDSGRPTSTAEYATGEDSKGLLRDTLHEENESDFEDSDSATPEDEDTDYPDMVGDLLSDIDSIQSPPPSRATPRKDRKNYDQAATKIQAHVKGYLTRKKVKQAHEHSQDFLPPDDEDSEPEPLEPEPAPSTPRAPDELEEDNEVGEAREAAEGDDEAALIIQKNYRGYLVRKRVKLDRLKHDEENLDLADLAEDEDDEGPVGEGEPIAEAVPEQKSNEEFTDVKAQYIITVFTGNRWAADTEADLYIVLHGEQGSSDKQYLCQEPTNWLHFDEPKFRQNRADSFEMKLPVELGRLNKITIGHERRGYGAGIFIDQVIITDELHHAPVSYLFQVFKWLDSGQVDGRIERTIKCGAIYFSNGGFDTRSRGRWEVVLHNGTPDGKGATTSSLSIFAYSYRKMSSSGPIKDASLQEVPSTTFVQIDFGTDFAEMIKLRVEIDGVGKMPDYYLDYVELRDIDTDEHLEVPVHKWLKWESEERGAQAFRELVIFRGKPTTLPLNSYEGKIRIAPSKIPLCSPSFKLELFGDVGECGIFPATAKRKSLTEKTDISFRIEAVSIGRVIGIRVYFDPTPEGEAIFEGLSTVQRVVGDNNVSVGSDFLVSYVIIRDSQHAPYRALLNYSRIQPRLNEYDSYVKELRLTNMEGLSTKISRSKEQPRMPALWAVNMSIDYMSRLLPEVTLCGELASGVMLCDDQTPVDNTLNYSLAGDLGSLIKIRVSVDRRKKLLHTLPDRMLPSGPERVVVKKIRLLDTANGDELRLPHAFADLGRQSVVEFPVFWPDVPPQSSTIFDISVVVGPQSSFKQVDIYVNLLGDVSDTGYRYLGDPDAYASSVLSHESDKTYCVEAISIGNIQAFEVIVNAAGAEYYFELAELAVKNVATQHVDSIAFVDLFTLENSHQIVRLANK